MEGNTMQAVTMLAALLDIVKKRKHSNSKPKQIVIPDYPIPPGLIDVLDTDLKINPATSRVSHKYIEILETLRKVECLDVAESHYFQLLKLALYLEEMEVDIKIERYVYLFCDEEYKRFRVIRTPRKPGNNNFQNYPLRCGHYALELMSQRSTMTYLFPHDSKSFVEDEFYDCSDRQRIYRNPDIASNAEQSKAIRNIVSKSSFPAPYILYGPPGTGKTATLVEVLCQIHRDPFKRVLVCTPSNTAADEITRRLLHFLSPDSVYRMYSQSKEGSTIDKKIQLCSNLKNEKVVLPKYKELMEKRIVITTLCNSIRLIRMRIPADHFSYVIIDEAGQGTEPDMLIPISLVSENGRLHSQIVFAGDPQQLGPTVISKLANSILGRSILERLMSYDIYKKNINNKYNPKYITKLLENYRSHPDIIHTSNKLFYENELIAKGPRSNEKDKFPIVFHGIEGKEEKDVHSHSVCNLKEVDVVVEYVNALLEDKLDFEAVTAEDIGIITPFTFQSEKIKDALEEKKIKGINVGTVDSFQGQERKVIVMTTVRSKTFVHEGKRHIGHLSNAKRFNVAITRPKKLLIIVGNPSVLQIDESWSYLLKFCMDNNSYKGAKFTLNNSSDEKPDVTSNLVKSTDLFNELSLPLHTGTSRLSECMKNVCIAD